MDSHSEITTAHRAIVSAARSFLRGEIGVVQAARAISRHRLTVDLDMNDEELVAFMAIDSESDRLAVGPVLDEWAPSLRAGKVQEIADFEQFYREQALRDAAALVRRFGSAV